MTTRTELSQAVKLSKETGPSQVCGAPGPRISRDRDAQRMDTLPARIENQISIWFSHEVGGGV
jgi:hypothetical protein